MWGLVIAAATLISTYTLYGYRISALEKQVNENSAQIASINSNWVQVQISLTKLQTDIEYIKLQIDKISP